MGVIGPTGSLAAWTVEHARRLMRALPPGRLFAFAESSDEFGLLKAIAKEAARVRAEAEGMFVTMHPGRATGAALDAWEDALGLPECSDASTDTERRQQAAWAKFRARQGGQSRAYYIALVLERFGLAATITEWLATSAFTCVSECDDEIYTMGARNTWALNLPMTDESWFTCESECDDVLHVWGHHELECLLTSLKPSHTRLLFRYEE